MSKDPVGVDANGVNHRLNLFVYGIGVEYPPHKVRPSDVTNLARRFYPSSQALDKVLAINKCTGIESRSSAIEIEHPLLNAERPPPITELCDFFLDHGVKLAAAACRTALEQWGGKLSDITHVVATTCTNSANPGFDSYLVKSLGLQLNVEKILLHGVGCSGGLAALRTASNTALGFSFRRKPARILVVACEITSVLVRSELESVHKNQEVRIGSTIFSDGASAVVLGNGMGEQQFEKRQLEVLGWQHSVIEGTERDLGFNVDSTGWKVVLTPNVPKVTSAALPVRFRDLIDSIPELSGINKTQPTDYDWALHPGGLTVITGVEKALGLSRQHLRATYEVYARHGNSSSASIVSVLNTLLSAQTKTHIVACAFGPGIAIEMMVFERSLEAQAGILTSAVELVPCKKMAQSAGTAPLATCKNAELAHLGLVVDGGRPSTTPRVNKRRREVEAAPVLSVRRQDRKRTSGRRRWPKASPDVLNGCSTIT